MSQSQSTIRVRYAETDQMGVAYHGALLPWFEIGRTDWLKQSGVSYADIEKKWSIHLAVVEASFKYIKRIHYDDELTVHTTCLRFKTVRIDFAYDIYWRDTLVVQGKTTHACVDTVGQPKRWPEELKQKLEKLIQP